MKAYEQNFLNSSKYLLDLTIEILAKYPFDYIPDDSVGRSIHSNNFLQFDKNNEPKKREYIENLNVQLGKIINQFPDQMMFTYINNSLIISDAIEVAKENHPSLLFDNLFGDDSRIEELMKTIMLKQAGINLDEVVDSTGYFTPKIPYGHTINALLGPEATKWIQAPSKDNPGKVQPHETSRVNWFKLNRIHSQIQIENELFEMGKLEPLLSKVVVGCLWSMKGLASVMNPNIFISESKAHVSASSEGNFTVSQGLETHTIVNYKPGSFIPILKLFKEVISDPILEACDMMWIAHGMTRVRNIKPRHSVVEIKPEGQTSLFLSHRGRDTKKDLMDFLLKSNKKNVFLDCLSLPLKLVNRNFVFKNLVNAKKVLILKTKNFGESLWCQKEERLSELLGQLNFLEYEKLSSIDGGLARLYDLKDGEDAPDLSYNKTASSEISWTVERILRDGDSFHGQKPNLYTLKDKKQPVDIFSRTIGFLDAHRQFDPSTKRRYTSKDIENEVNYLVDAAFNYIRIDQLTKDNSNISLIHEYLCVTTQFLIALFSLRSPSYDKMEVRKYINVNNKLCMWFLEKMMSSDNRHLPLLKGQLVFIAACLTLELTNSANEFIEMNGVGSMISPYGVYKDGMILLDVRDKYKINPMLSTMTNMVFNHDVGTVGILQHANNQIHQSVVDGFNLEVIPCVTFYDGMEAWFLKN